MNRCGGPVAATPSREAEPSIDVLINPLRASSRPHCGSELLVSMCASDRLWRTPVRPWSGRFKPRGQVEQGRLGEVGLPLALGEVMVDAGDLVMGDRDGVVVVPQAHVAVIAERLERVAALEAEMHAKVGRGEIRTLLDRWPELRDQISYVD